MSVETCTGHEPKIPVMPTFLYTLVVNGVEQTDKYIVQELKQDEFLELKHKLSNILYIVQPTDELSGPIHFLGDIPVDMTKSIEGEILYVRNWLTKTSAVGITRENGDLLINDSMIVARMGIKPGQHFSFLAEIVADQANKKEVYYRYKVYEGLIKSYDFSTHVKPGATTEIALDLSRINNVSTRDYGFYLDFLMGTAVAKKERLLAIPLENVEVGYTLAPEDIINDEVDKNM